MNAPSGRHCKETARAAEELAALQREIAAARAVLEQLQQAVRDTTRRLADAGGGTLVAVNEQLVVSAIRAQTEAQEATQALEQVKHTTVLDPLTHLPNRSLLPDRFHQAVAHAKREGERVALLFVDLDDFKHINDSLGHAVGDEMIRLAADRLVASVREVDTVIRYGGDEFLVLVTDVSDVTDAGTVAAQILACLARGHVVNGQQLALSASIGISLYPDDGDDIYALIERADEAMYCAKRNGARSFAYHAADCADGAAQDVRNPHGVGPAK